MEARTSRRPGPASPAGPPGAIDALAADLERVAVGAVGLTSRALAEAAPGTELTFQQWRALLILGEDPGGARVGQVATRVGVTLPATSRLLRRLERRGFVALATDEVDRRATRAQLTIRGNEVRSAILRYRGAALRPIADRMRQLDAGTAGSTVEALAEAFGSFS
jgi:DNA-binding MarR family transcriptional regulator